MHIEQSLATQQYKFIPDDSILLDEAGCSVLVNRLLPALQTQPGAKLVVPERVLQTVRDRQSQAGLNVIRLFAQQQKLDRRGEEREIAGDNAGTRDLLVRVAYQFQQRHKLAFLTLDEETARALLATNQAQSIGYAEPLRVLRLNSERTGLTDWDRCCTRNEEKAADTDTVPHALDALALASCSRIVIDTCSFMTPGANLFFHKKLIPALMHYNNKILLAQRTIFELEKHANKSLVGLSEPELEVTQARIAHAQSGLAIIHELQAVGLADIRQEENEVAGCRNFVDPLILRVFVQHQKNTKLALITQDTRLAQQILENARNLNAGATAPKVGFINTVEKSTLPIGELGNWEWRLTWPVYAENAGSANGLRSNHNGRKPSHHPSWKREPFKIASTVYSGSTAIIPVQVLPTEGDVVTGDRSGSLTLLNRISEGGEGAIYKTSLSEIICKIYFKDRLTEDRKAKLELMVTRQSPDRMICWPLELVRNRYGDFVGYLMPLAKGETFNLSIFKKPLLQEMFPHWRREHLIQLAITTLGLVKKLHDLNVLIGDINPNNFMVCNEQEVYLVDTDSVQIEAFPCPVGTPHFTPPELIGQSYGDFLRTKEHEIFAVATLLFMILLPGKPPYSGQGGGDVVESIQKRKFPYVQEKGEESARPFGPYRFIWSALHPLLKQDFTDIFYEGSRAPDSQPDGRNSARPTANYVDRFLFDLRVYMKAIQSGRNSNELFPSDIWLRTEEEKVEIPCMEPGCNRIARFSKGFHQGRVQVGQTRFRCPIHFETNRLRNQMREQTGRIPSSSAYARPTRRPQPPASPAKSSINWGSLVQWAMILLFLVYLFFLRK
ncbi:MAG: hypothetical protein LM522_01530 [Candidatus Contendobacter sp.]|nr:hypothetical protein [Candidatus Contendobacter sp.]